MKTIKFLLWLLMVMMINIPMVLSAQGQQDKRASISAIDLEWNEELHIFDTFFYVKNLTADDIELSGVILFKMENEERVWRGFRLPVIPADDLRFFKVSFPAGFLLKDDYNAIAVNIYNKNYKELIDSSARHVTVTSHRVMVDEKPDIEITEISPGYGRIDTEVVSQQYIPGLEKKQSVVLTPITKGDSPVTPGDVKTSRMLFSPIISARTDKGNNILSWEQGDGDIRYNLYWSNTRGVTRYNGKQIRNVHSGFKHPHQDRNTAFYYVVTAEKNGRESGESNEVAVTPIARTEQHQGQGPETTVAAAQDVTPVKSGAEASADNSKGEKTGAVTENNTQRRTKRGAQTVSGADKDPDAQLASNEPAPEPYRAPKTAEPEESVQKKGSRVMAYVLSVLSIF
ncbi:MAG: hypothetical protein ABIK68_02720 [bacterium]